MAEYLLRAYPERREAVEEDEAVEEVKEEKKADKKPAKKSK
jgi:hypothetical protein